MKTCLKHRTKPKKIAAKRTFGEPADNKQGYLLVCKQNPGDLELVVEKGDFIHLDFSTAIRRVRELAGSGPRRHVYKFPLCSVISGPVKYGSYKGAWALKTLIGVAAERAY